MAFIHVRHTETQGEADIPEGAADYYAALGWEPYDPPAPEVDSEPEPPRKRRSTQPTSSPDDATSQED